MPVTEKKLRTLVNTVPMQWRLSFWVVVTVGSVFIVSAYLGFHRQWSQHQDAVLASLQEQAHALAVARRRMVNDSEFDNYVRDFCAQMNSFVSPGHHILVLDDSGHVRARAQQHSGPDVEKVLLKASPTQSILVMGEHTLVQTRLVLGDGTTLILAQYLDHVEQMLHSQFYDRLWSVSLTALALIVLSYGLMQIWVIRPIRQLTSVAKQWAMRRFDARVESTGGFETQFLATELNQMAAELEAFENRRTMELEQATKIQHNLLPSLTLNIPGLRVASAYQPAEHVAGDIYDVFNLSAHQAILAVIDVCGHDISAALLTGVVKMALHRRLAETADLSSAMDRINADLMDMTPDGKFVTACVGIWDSRDRSWTYCAAGHPAGLLLRKQTIHSLTSSAPLFGLFDTHNWPTQQIQLMKNDRLFLYTDGMIDIEESETEARAPTFEQRLLKHADLDLQTQVQRTMTEIRSHTHDDTTLLAIEVL